MSSRSPHLSSALSCLPPIVRLYDPKLLEVGGQPQIALVGWRVLPRGHVAWQWFGLAHLLHPDFPTLFSIPFISSPFWLVSDTCVLLGFVHFFSGHDHHHADVLCLPSRVPSSNLDLDSCTRKAHTCVLMLFVNTQGNFSTTFFTVKALSSLRSNQETERLLTMVNLTSALLVVFLKMAN